MISDQAEAVRRILNEYIGVHNELFGGGWFRTLRRLLPIPGLFHAIDFAEHARTLAILGIHLEAIRAEIRTGGAPSQLAVPLAAYSEALLDAVRKLAHMCAQLDQRRDSPAAYSESQYRDDLTHYETAVAHYRRMGQELNRVLRAPLS